MSGDPRYPFPARKKLLDAIRKLKNDKKLLLKVADAADGIPHRCLTHVGPCAACAVAGPLESARTGGAIPKTKFK